MAGEIADFIVKLSTVFDDKGLADAKKAIEDTLDPIEAMKEVLGEIGLMATSGAAIWGLVEFGKESLVEFGKLEESSVRLSTAMKTLGIYTDDAFGQMQKFAEEMQQKSAFDKVAIQDMSSLLTTFGLYGKKLEEVAEGAMNLAVARHMDLNSAAMLLGRAYDGNTTMLKRYGIQIQDTGSVSGNFAEVMRLVNERFGGAAAAQVGTYNGQIAQMTHNFDDLKQKIGAELLPVASAWIGWINEAIDKTGELVGVEENAKKGRELTIDALQREKDLLAGQMAALGTHATAETASSAIYLDLQKKIDAVNQAMEREQALLKVTPEAQPGKPKFGPQDKDPKADQAKFLADYEANQQKEFAARQKTLSDEYEKYVSTKNAEKDVEGLNLAQQLEMAGQHQDAMDVLRQRDAKLQKALNAQLKQDVQDTFSAIATLKTAKTKELAAIGKAAAIVEATINTEVAFTNTLRHFPFPINIALAGLVATAGMAQVANIAGVQLAEGGIVRARAGGVQATIGEGGKDEAVIPLGDSRTAQRLRAALGGRGLGGGGPQITVHQQVTFAGGAGGAGAGGRGEQDIAELMDRMRVATKQGIAEALDAVKQFKITADDRSGEA